MDFLRNFLSSIVILLVIPLLLVATISLVARETVFSERFVKRQAEESRLYDGLAGLAQHSLTRQVNDQKFQSAVTSAVTAERLKAAFEPAVTKFFAYLHKKTNDETIVVDLRPIKSDIQRNVPSIKPSEFDQLLPDELRSRPPTSGQPSRLTQLRDTYNTLNQLSRWAPYVVVALLLVLALINKGRSRLRRPAYVLLVGGLLLGIVGGLVVMVIPLALRRLGENPNFPAIVNETINTLAKNVSSDVTRLLLVFGAGYIVLAILLFVASFFIGQPLKIETGPGDRSYDPRRGIVKR